MNDISSRWYDGGAYISFEEIKNKNNNLEKLFEETKKNPPIVVDISDFTKIVNAQILRDEENKTPEEREEENRIQRKLSEEL